MLSNYKNFNYMEINILNNNSTNNSDNIIDINWNENDFNKSLQTLSKKLRPFEKQQKITKYNDLILITNLSDNKLNLYTLSYINHFNIKNNILAVEYNKNNLPPYQFPSTNNINDKYYLNKIIFKITNRIYINFELMKKYENNNENIYRRIYINFNNEKKNLEIIKINEILEKCMKDYFS
jgi:hypothetical protein